MHKKMKNTYKIGVMNRTGINVNKSVEGETMEQQVERMVSNKEPIVGESPLIFTERKDGVMAGYNVRTDRFDVALEATDVISRSRAAKREHKAEMNIVKDKEEITGGESTQGKVAE